MIFVSRQVLEQESLRRIERREQFPKSIKRSEIVFRLKLYLFEIAFSYLKMATQSKQRTDTSMKAWIPGPRRRNKGPGVLVSSCTPLVSFASLTACVIFYKNIGDNVFCLMGNHRYKLVHNMAGVVDDTGARESRVRVDFSKNIFF